MYTEPAGACMLRTARRLGGNRIYKQYREILFNIRENPWRLPIFLAQKQGEGGLLGQGSALEGIINIKSNGLKNVKTTDSSTPIPAPSEPEAGSKEAAKDSNNDSPESIGDINASPLGVACF